ncbi:MAG: hypothetical protein SV375_15930, partial [Thermodesulfobacteriota bacterium]|nr:hypothetical protein [Thermodesulfobacteriota bacterium]
LPSLCKQYSEQFNRVQREFFQIMKWANRGKDTYELGILPLMIVPTPYKPFSQMVFGELRDIWRQAFESLREADEALACGFSFRDDHFNQILREATRSRGCPLNLTVVDPSVHTLKHIEATLSMCNINPTLLATDLGDFVEGLV